MKRIVIIGGGFAGLSTAFHLCRQQGHCFRVSVVDKKEYFNFLPALPDIIGRDIAPEALEYPLAAAAERGGFDFTRAEVDSVDLKGKKIICREKDMAYDYLVIGSGSETNFYGNKQIETDAFRLDNTQDSRAITAALEQDKYERFVICGGGYTGVEIATQVRMFFARRRRKKRIVIVERSPFLLGAVPERLRGYVLDNLKRLNIDIFSGNSVAAALDGAITLEDGTVFKKAMLIWCAGVKTASFIERVDAEKDRQGRIKVDAFLRFSENCFAVGDAAAFSYKQGALRMAVQFALAQGKAAAINIRRLHDKKALQGYVPCDLGYIIPMANNRSCGVALGLEISGRIPTLLHYAMCVYLMFGWEQQRAMLGSLLFHRRRHDA
ncbi:MAG: FAD-dependent oxidoreductase [Candidatus Omnitrophica bacterium]|nr:FAD-dependent oxidoreductase [Candidatus Omnitrophota bacterium]MCG2704353.1 FAD-dependent oxidoreductase [Candidatus Omnitrophota bacterium]